MLGENAVNDYVKKVTGDKNATRLIDKIKMNSLLKIDGTYCYLIGKADERRVLLCNANQFIISDEDAAYLKKISRFCEKNKKAEGKLTADEQHDGLTKEKNLEFYRMLVKRLEEKPYCLLPMPDSTTLLKSKENVFVMLNIEEQCSVIMEIMHFFQCNSVESDLTLLDGKKTGMVRRSKTIDPDEEILLIYQSPTGFYQKTVSLTGFYKA